MVNAEREASVCHVLWVLLRSGPELDVLDRDAILAGPREARFGPDTTPRVQTGSESPEGPSAVGTPRVQHQRPVATHDHKCRLGSQGVFGQHSMVILDDLIVFLRHFMGDVGDKDAYMPKGLQVRGRAEIRLLATGVSASLRLFEETVARWPARAVQQ